MKDKNKTRKVVSTLLISGILVSIPTISSEAAVITSNATDKVAVVFNENTAYSAGDYVTYDGEMYICTEDIQGAWSTAEAGFMQITKNHELGKTEDLSAAYAASEDPSTEKSLMAFTANAWQKLKFFLGIDEKTASTDAANYKNASVSGKLNYLEQQNQSLSQNLGNLQNSVNQSFSSVSNGKSLLAGAIADEGGKASPLDTFLQMSESIRDLAKKKYDTGYNTGHDTGYHAGHDEGYTGGYEDGISFADGRVNKDSASYKQAASENNTQKWEFNVTLTYDGPNKNAEYFSSGQGFTSNHKEWTFFKRFSGHIITAAYVRESYYSPYGGNDRSELFSALGGRQCQMSNDGQSRLVVSSNSISWGPYDFNVLDKSSEHMELEFIVEYR